MTRPLRALFVANDGLSTGHVARTAAVAQALARKADARIVIATTSRAHALLEPFVTVTLPSPGVGRGAGFSDTERRRLVRGALEGIVESFAPDILVVDTFPSGPHGELAGLAPGRRRALLRRTVPDGELLAAGIEAYDVAIVADDPDRCRVDLPVRVVPVAPITLDLPADRAAARAKLGITGRAVLVTWGGGGDEDAGATSRALAATVARLARDATVFLATGPLAAPCDPPAGVTLLGVAPLQPWLAAFDGAFSAAGYNTAHELARAGVPAALFARPRPYDDQAARAARFAFAGFAVRLESFEDGAVAAALAWMESAPRPTLPPSGANDAAAALLECLR